jgi:Alkylmercury lyase
MADLKLLDGMFYIIMQHFINTGQAPHYTELAKNLGLSMEEGRKLLHDLMEAPCFAYAGGRYPGWLYPGTDYIASFAPFNNLPTQYRITIDGQQKWFAQCGLEALAIRWLFPGKTVRVDAPCLDCGEPLAVEMRDKEVLSVQPRAVFGYAYRGFGGPPEGRAYR